MSMKILVVDDSAVMRKLIIRSLEMSGIPIESIETAANGQIALEKLTASPFDLALVDINMPVMNGIELIQAVRTSHSIATIPIVVVSTEGSTTRLATLEKYSVGFVHKPFTPEDLVDAVIGAIGGTSGITMENETSCGGGPDF